MTVEPFGPALSANGYVPDAASAGGDAAAVSAPSAESFTASLGKAFADASASLGRAESSERAFAAGRGGLQEMVLQRAQADVALSLASAAASRASQALSTILGMQV